MHRRVSAKHLSPLIVLAGLLGNPSHAQFEPMLDESAMDRSADPCVDFQRYACGNWIDNTEIPADSSSWYRSFSTIDEENVETNKKLLEDFSQGINLELASNSRKLGDFYAGCMNTSAIVRETREFLEQQFAPLQNLNSKNLSKIIGDLHARGISVLMRYGADQDAKNSSQMIAFLDQGGMGLPTRDYYFDQSKEKKSVRRKYLKHIAKMLQHSGLSAKRADADARLVLEFETKLARKALAPEDRRDPKELYHIHSLEELKRLVPRINWDIALSTMGSPSILHLNVAVPEFFVNLNEVLASTPIRHLKAYLRWRMISSFSLDLGSKFAKERFDFYGKTLSGQKEMIPRWKYCVNQADNSLADALGEAFVAKTFGEKGKEKASEILENIQNQFRENLQNLEWMDEPTRSYAVEKLDTIMKKIGYPNQWRDLSDLTISRSHMNNVVATSQFAHAWDLNKIGKPVDRSDWGMTPPTVNAYYNPANNEIVFPAGILQSPMFSISAPDVANYGAFGAVIGHEITHGFDDEGRQYDKEGNLRDWWTSNIGEVFTSKTQCLIDQYSNYTVAGNTHVNGKLTLGENIADLGGVKMSLTAFERSLPTGITEEQKSDELKKFFTAYAQIWCAKATPEYEKLLADTDPHSPGKYRINGVVTNLPAFAQTFGCKKGQPLNPANRCTIW